MCHSCLFEQLVVLFSTAKHLSSMLFLLPKFFLVLLELLDLLVVLLYLFFVYLRLLDHVLLERHSFLNEPIVLLFLQLSLLHALHLLVLLPRLQLAVVLG